MDQQYYPCGYRHVVTLGQTPTVTKTVTDAEKIGLMKVVGWTKLRRQVMPLILQGL
jgi:hypothetical protein